MKADGGFLGFTPLIIYSKGEIRDDVSHVGIESTIV